MERIVRHAAEHERLEAAEAPAAEDDQITALFFRQSDNFRRRMADELAALVRHAEFVYDAACAGDRHLLHLRDIVGIHPGEDDFAVRPGRLIRLEDSDEGEMCPKLLGQRGGGGGRFECTFRAVGREQDFGKHILIIAAEPQAHIRQMADCEVGCGNGDGQTSAGFCGLWVSLRREYAFSGPQAVIQLGRPSPIPLLLAS